MLIPIDFYNLNKSTIIVKKFLSDKKKKGFLNLKTINFNNYLM